MTQERQMIELLLHEFGDHHNHGCPADLVPAGECNCYAGALCEKARALLAASTASDKQEVICQALAIIADEIQSGGTAQSCYDAICALMVEDQSVAQTDAEALYEAWQSTFAHMDSQKAASDKQEAVGQIAEVCQDADGYKHIEAVIEDLDDIPAGTKLYPAPRTLTRAEIEEIAHYVETECKACPGMTTLYIAAEAAVEETLRRLAVPPAQSAEQDRIDAERYRKWVSYSGFTKEHCDATLDPIKINEHVAKGASK
jgi:hypothetical protein